jgi:hypothetical protein
MYGFGIDYYKNHILMLSFVIYIMPMSMFGSPKACVIDKYNISIKIV